MVYNVSKKECKKKDRFSITGKLISIQTDADRCEVFDQKMGKYSWVRLSMVIGKDKYFNVTVYHVDMAQMLELKKADDYLKTKIKPFVSLKFYQSEKLAFDKSGQSINEEVVQKRDGKEVIVLKQRKYLNYCCSPADIIKDFKIVSTNADYIIPEMVK